MRNLPRSCATLNTRRAEAAMALRHNFPKMRAKACADENGYLLRPIVILAGCVLQNSTTHYLLRLAMAIAMTVSGVCTAAGVDGPVYSLFLQTDARILIGGGFTHTGSVARDGLARLFPDGSVDSGFVPRTGPAGGFGCIAVQADGKVITSGTLHVGSSYELHLLRLLPNGAVEAGFADISGNGGAAAIVVQPDGKILIGGDFEFIGGQPHNRAGRINADGSVDETFDPNFARGNTGAVSSIQQAAGGKLFFGGEFPIVNATSVSGFTRLDANGSIDPTFAWDPGLKNNNAVNAITLQPDGKILVGGNIFLAGLAGGVSLARLNVDGSTDLAFTNNVASANLLGVQSMALLSDGKILIAGFDGQGSLDNVQRVNADGTLDLSFHPAVNNIVLSLVATPAGKILIGGYFTQVNGAPQAYLARLNEDGSTDPTFVVDSAETIFSNGFD